MIILIFAFVITAYVAAAFAFIAALLSFIITSNKNSASGTALAAGILELISAVCIIIAIIVASHYWELVEDYIDGRVSIGWGICVSAMVGVGIIIVAAMLKNSQDVPQNRGIGYQGAGMNGAYQQNGYAQNGYGQNRYAQNGYGQNNNNYRQNGYARGGYGQIGTVAVSNAYLTGMSGSLAGRAFDASNAQPLVIGRDPASCNVVVDANDTVVSHRHCMVRFVPNTNSYCVQDLDSMNGTFIGNMNNRLPALSEQNVPRGVIIYLADGKTSFKLS